MLRVGDVDWQVAWRESLRWKISERDGVNNPFEGVKIASRIQWMPPKKPGSTATLRADRDTRDFKSKKPCRNQKNTDRCQGWLQPSSSWGVAHTRFSHDSSQSDKNRQDSPGEVGHGGHASIDQRLVPKLTATLELRTL
ncbi:hypothetical protein EVAR_51622_1 [Eumeta japonica]|uniref:Uncharacterized protein n=1 Tax=Eumeta variegata TaxID=151549 RepID=A0A4C1YGE8_EUMVA|nr:hypothetical protein EVAR_51622_1 [Eumeta japonica]